MKINYNGLWKVMIDKGMNKKELMEEVGLSPATVAKMTKGEFVSMQVLYRICIKLDVDFKDIIEIGNREDKHDR
ncbi:helix-turn-helix domain-containing protein [Facklamia sp. P12955]|uniref:helix-turn-helix domain-containing protein n=1 Tax=unclassified Facklamia TaxID=2622293 RepID=UPI003D1843E8